MKSAGSRTLLLRLERGPPLARGRQHASSVAWLVGSYPKHSAWCLLVAARQQKQSTQCTSKESQLTMRRATSGASIGPLSKQLTPILSVAAHEGPYAFKFKGLTLWLAKNAASEIARGLPGHRHPAPHLRRPRGRRRRETAGRNRAKRAARPGDSVAMRPRFGRLTSPPRNRRP